MVNVLRAVPDSSRVFLLGAAKDLPAHSIGQPFAELTQGGPARVFQASLAASQITATRSIAAYLSGTLKANDETFDPTQAISWLSVPSELLIETLPVVVRSSPSSYR
jgi:hypothetical protein